MKLNGSTRALMTKGPNASDVVALVLLGYSAPKPLYATTFSLAKDLLCAI